jgi:hypothetical protein
MSLIEVVATHRGARFPGTATEVGLPEWDEAARRGVDEAAREWSAGLGSGRVPVEVLERIHLALFASGGAFAPGAEGHRRGPDGIDVVVQAPALDAVERDRLRADGGGIVVRGARRRSPELDRLVTLFGIARRARADAIAVHGSEPTRVLGGQVGQTCVLPVTGAVVVQPDGGPPFDLRPGEAITLPGIPRLAADPDATTVLIVEEVFTDRARRAMLADRARYHPLLRVDAPVPGSGPAEVYGIDGPVDYGDLVRGQLDALLAASPTDAMRDWWRWDERLPPTRFASGPAARVRGRFPGGIGVVELGDAVLARAGGVNLVAQPEAVALVARLLERAPVALSELGSMPRVVEALSVLASVGLVEEVPGADVVQ